MQLCWIDRLRSLSPSRGPLCTAIVLGLVPHGIAILLLLIIGQGRLALQRPLFLFTAGIMWTLFFYLMCAQDYKQHLALLRLALKPKEVDYFNRLKARHLRNLGMDRRYLIPSLIIWSVGLIIIWLDIYGFLPTTIPSPLRMLPTEWVSLDYRPVRLIALAVFGLPITALIWTTGWFIVSHSSFLARISRLKYIDSPNLYFLRLQPLLQINMLAAFSWSVGVSMVAYYLRTARLPPLIIFIVILQSVATYAFFLPTWLFQKKLRKIGLRRIKSLLFASKQGFDPLDPDPTKWSELLLLEDQIAKQLAEPSFNVWLKYIGYLVTTFLIPLLTAIIGTLLTTWLAPSK